MVDPKTVVYKRVHELEIIYESDSYAIASFFYKGKLKLAFRWNGNETPKSKGTPTAYGKPTWMLIPEDFLEKLGFALDQIRNRKKKLSN